MSEAAIQSMSRGLVGDITFGVLPEVKAVHCFGITIALNAVSVRASTPVIGGKSCPFSTSYQL